MTDVSQNILDNVLALSKDYEGLTALYVIDLEKMKMRHQILNDTHNKATFMDRIQKITLTLQDREFEMLLVDLDERIICRKVDDTHIIVFVTDKEMTLGKVFTLIRGINYQGDSA